MNKIINKRKNPCIKITTIFLLIICFGGNILLSPGGEIMCEEFEGQYMLENIKIKWRKTRINKLDIIEELQKRNGKMKLFRKLIRVLLLILAILIIVNLPINSFCEIPINPITYTILIFAAGDRLREGETYNENNIRAEIKEEDNIKIEFEGIGDVIFSRNDKQNLAVVISFMSLFKPAGKNKLTQDEIGLMVGLSRQQINERIKRFRSKIDGGLESLVRKVKVTGEVKKRVVEILLDNIHSDNKSISEQIVKEGLCKKISSVTIGNIFKELNINQIKETIQKQFKAQKAAVEKIISLEYITDKLTEIVKTKLEDCNEEDKKRDVVIELEELQKRYPIPVVQKRGKYKLNQKPKSKNRRRNRDSRERMLRAHLTGNQRTEVCCPQCGETVKIGHKKTDTYEYLDETGKFKTGIVYQYRCYNPRCCKKTFTIKSDGVELYARVSPKIKRGAFKSCMELKGSYRDAGNNLVGGSENLKIQYTRLMRWIQKAGNEMARIHRVFGINNSGFICVDEKWIKVLGEWVYVYLAVDDRTYDLLHIEAYYSRDSRSIKTFLLELKHIGIRPQVITTDLLNYYEKEVREVFPDAIYNQCILHAESSATKILIKYLGDDPEKKIYTAAREILRKIFSSKSENEADKNVSELEEYIKINEYLQPVLENVKRYMPKLKILISNPKINRTNNAVERVIGIFSDHYKIMRCFNSFYSARAFCYVFMCYYRFRKFTSGKYKGECSLEVSRYDIKDLDWTKYLTSV